MKIEQDEETGQWIVYSQEFDYMAYGKTQDEALDNFECGLFATITERVKAGCSPLLK